MKIKTILAVVDVDHFQEDVKNAIAVCQSIDAHLSATVVAIDQSPYAGAYGEAAVTAWFEEREAALANLARQVETVKKMLAVTTTSEHAWNDLKIGNRSRIDIEDRDRLWFPQRNEI